MKERYMYLLIIGLKLMFKILIVEDDEFKLSSLKQFLDTSFTLTKIYEATNLYDATIIINEVTFDLILLDMSIPSHPFQIAGGTPKSLPIGGLQVIFELKSLKRTDDCIIITQYPDIEICGSHYPINKAEKSIFEHYNYNVLKCIQYSEGATLWKSELTKVFNNYENFNS